MPTWVFALLWVLAFSIITNCLHLLFCRFSRLLVLAAPMMSPLFSVWGQNCGEWFTPTITTHSSTCVVDRQPKTKRAVTRRYWSSVEQVRSPWIPTRWTITFSWLSARIAFWPHLSWTYLPIQVNYLLTYYYYYYYYYWWRRSVVVASLV